MKKTIKVLLENKKQERVKYDLSNQILVKEKNKPNKITNHYIIEMDAFAYGKLNNDDKVVLINLDRDSNGVFVPFQFTSGSKGVLKLKSEVEHAQTFEDN